MQRTSVADGDEQRRCAAAEGMMMLLRRERERELVAQLHELLFPSPAPSGAGGASWSSSETLNVAECSPVSCGGGRRRRGSKRDREDEQGQQEKGQEQHGGDGGSENTRCRRKKKKKKQGTTLTALVTTVPDFDGYQWRKYGQKQIEAAQYPRSYYRCTNSTDQSCPAKRTVQRNDDGNGSGPPKYTVVYISEHTCKATESAPPVILETTVARTKNPAADHDAAAHVTPAAAAAPDVIAAVAPLFAESPAISDITWSGDANPSLSEHDYCSLVFAGDEYWDRTTAAPAAGAVRQEMDFAGPIRSPVHVAADGWIDGLFVNEPSVLNSCHLFGL